MSGGVGFGNFTYAPEATTAARDADFYVLEAAADGVTQIVAGNASITVSPAGGTGVVTLTVPPPASPFVAGMIMMWNSPIPPDGWALCDGGSGRPDLTDRFAVGAGNLYSYDQTGGTTGTTLTLDMIPDHTHGGVGLSLVSSNNSSGGYSYAATDANTTGISNPGYTPGAQVPTLPPYIGIYYIIKL